MTSCQLSDRQKQCLRLKRKGLTDRQIGESLGIETGTVHTHLRRGRRRLRDAERLVAEFSQKDVDGDAR